MGPNTSRPARDGRTEGECSNRLTWGSAPAPKVSWAAMMSASSAISDPEAPSEVAVDGRTGLLKGVLDWFRDLGPRMRGLFAFLLYLCSSILVFALPVISDLGHRCVGACLSASQGSPTWGTAGAPPPCWTRTCTNGRSTGCTRR